MKIVKVWLFWTFLFTLTIIIHGQEAVNFRNFIQSQLDMAERRTTENGKTIVKKGIPLSEICNIDYDVVDARIFADYGAIFLPPFVGTGVRVPTKCVFDNQIEAQNYQERANPVTQTLGGVKITLQKPAMDALMAAVAEARQKNLSITPRGGSTAAARSYGDTERLWNSRFLPGLNYWVGRGKISRADAEVVKKMKIKDQVAQVLEWEKQRLWFSTGFDKSILYSVAAPGASQHIFMLALDVEQFGNKQVRDILAKYGWFQTVVSDLPHFTFLGVSREKLPEYGLTRRMVSGQEFWIPNL